MVHDIIFMSGGMMIPFVRLCSSSLLLSISLTHLQTSWTRSRSNWLRVCAGASLIIPQVETVEQAKYVVSVAKYGTASQGTRSAPPCRLWPGLTDTPLDATLGLHRSLNQQAAVMIQIESLAGIQNLNATLAAVPDINAVFLGSLDARVSMGLPGALGVPGHEPEWLEAVKLFGCTVREHDKTLAGSSLGLGADEMRDEIKSLAMAWIAFNVMALMGLRDRLLSAREALEGDET